MTTKQAFRDGFSLYRRNNGELPGDGRYAGQYSREELRLRTAIIIAGRAYDRLEERERRYTQIDRALAADMSWAKMIRRLKRSHVSRPTYRYDARRLPAWF